MAGGLLRVTPWAPYLTFVLMGLAVGMLVRGPLWAGAVALVVGAGLFFLAGHWYPALDSGDPSQLLTLLLPPAGALAVQLLLWARIPSVLVAAALAAALCGLFAVQASTFIPTLDRRLGGEPRAETYSYDPVFFMKTFYLVERHGEGYYQAYGQASREDARFTQPISNLAGWRTPALTWLWALLFRSSHDIVVGFIVAAAVSMLLGFALAARLADAAVAVVVPALLFPYYLAALDSLHFLSYEVWAACFAMAAAALVAYRLDKLGLVFGIAAGVIREWFVSVLLAGIVRHLWRRRWLHAGVWALGLAAVVAVYALNIARAREYLLSVGVNPASGTQGRLGNGGPLFVLYTLQFNARFYAQEYVVPYAAFFLGLVGCAALLRRGEPFVPTLVLVPVAFFMLSGSGHKPGDPYGMDVYYSGAFLPFSMVAACCAGQLFRRRAKGEPAAAGENAESEAVAREPSAGRSAP